MRYLKLILLLLLAAPAWGADPEAEINRFLTDTFSQAPSAETLFLTTDIQVATRNILEHHYAPSRVRYWRSGTRTAWVLEEIGKEMPITVGISINDGIIEKVRILVYRESRGWEVKSPAFTAQFFGAKLSTEQKLDRQIDGISGATLSVRAVSRLSRVALLFERHVNAKGKL